MKTDEKELIKKADNCNCSETCDLSIVCINNNHNILNRFLLPSVRNQKNVRFELKIIDNCWNQYKGAREAFNQIAGSLKGKYIVFVHNDFFFTKTDSFSKIIGYCNQLEPFGVVGVAGCDFDSKKTIKTRIKHGGNKRRVGTQIEKSVSVMTVDECCFIIKRSQLLKIPFSEKKGWHLYAVEYCLQMLDCGLRNYVIPLDGWHFSDGVSLDAAYCKEIKSLLENYQNRYRFINTTVKQWKTDFFTREIYLRYYVLKQVIKSRLIKK